MNDNQLKKDNKFLLITLITIVTIILIILIYSFFIKNKTENETKTTSNVEEISINDYRIKELYNYVSSDDFWSYIDESKEKTIYTKDIDQDIKNEIAHYYLYTKDINMNNYCIDKYETVIKAYDTHYNCGFRDYLDIDGYTDTTFSFDEELLKKSTEKIFGKGSFSNASFTFFGQGTGYIYYKATGDATGKYIYVSAIGSILIPSPQPSLVSASKEGNKIIINIKLDFEEPSRTSNYKLLYYLGEEGYYLYSIEKL